MKKQYVIEAPVEGTAPVKNFSSNGLFFYVFGLLPCPGHGGDDPGKVGINDAKEKDINLQIAMLVKHFLEANDIEVVLTRDSDDGLYDTDASK